MKNTRRLTRCAALIALSLALSWAERLIPLEFLIPLPGVKLGFANIVTLFALVFLDKRSAFAILVCRCLLAGLLFGTGVSLLFSLCGGLAAFGIMALLLRFTPHRLTLYGVSVGGAAAHNAGQMLAAVLVLSPAVLSYLPLMLVFSVPCGLFTAFVALYLFPRLERLTFFAAFARETREKGTP